MSAIYEVETAAGRHLNIAIDTEQRKIHFLENGGHPAHTFSYIAFGCLTAELNLDAHSLNAATVAQIQQWAGITR